MLTLENDLIPAKLRAIPQPPTTLYYRGNTVKQLSAGPIVAIVGSRKVDDYGRHITKKFASELASHSITIVSGLALGVDAIAHQAALDAGGSTIGVLACGIECILPKTNERLGEQVLQSGGIVSEQDGTHAPHGYDFLSRNRIISGLADLVIVTQAAHKSGSLNTAMHAKKQGKPVMSVPGPITNPLCAGTNQLIAHGAHALIDSKQVIKLLGLTRQKRTKPLHKLTAIEDLIIESLKSGNLTTEDLCQSTQTPIGVLNATLTMLEIKGAIAQTSPTQWTVL